MPPKVYKSPTAGDDILVDSLRKPLTWLNLLRTLFTNSSLILVLFGAGFALAKPIVDGYIDGRYDAKIKQGRFITLVEYKEVQRSIGSVITEQKGIANSVEEVEKTLESLRRANESNSIILRSLDATQSEIKNNIRDDIKIINSDIKQLLRSLGRNNDRLLLNIPPDINNITTPVTPIE